MNPRAAMDCPARAKRQSLALAIVAWSNLWRRPAFARLDQAKGKKREEGEFASRLLMLAAGSSAVAAIVAIAGWFAT